MPTDFSRKRDAMRRSRDLQRDHDHLRLLAIFHYILGGWHFFTGCVPLFYLGFGIAVANGALDDARNPPPPTLAFVMVVFGFVGTLFLWGLALAQVLAGR